MATRSTVKRKRRDKAPADNGNGNGGISPLSARGRVREAVRKLILTGELAPGTRLGQQHLAERFGVAQTVVRESLLELQLSGLVHSVDNLGVFVSDLDAERLIQAYRVREVLEGLGASQACENASRADLKDLAVLAEEIHRLGVEGDLQRRGSLDRQFHHRIILLSRNAVLIRLTEAYHALGMVVQASRPHDVIRSEHLAIVDAIGRGDMPGAERLARQHVASVRAAIEAQVVAGAFEPRWVTD